MSTCSFVWAEKEKSSHTRNTL